MDFKNQSSGTEKFEFKKEKKVINEEIIFKFIITL